MKISFTLLFLLMAWTGFCQGEACEEFDLSEGEISMQMGAGTPQAFIALSRRVGEATDERKIVFTTNVPKCNSLKGVYVRLSNYDILGFEAYNLLCEDLPGGGYALSGSIALTDNLYDTLSKYEIVEFNLGGVGVLVHLEYYDEFRSMLACLHEAK
ncbi:hypothetical protein [Flavobacterium sp.]|uniref:hypothetical protein n=1 Tax=Flavobacterium sp. TaxID=239 RepID=UPI00260F644E|nr:hypothetical protein [Flavobacterium sp.]